MRRLKRSSSVLTPRWFPLRSHGPQQKLLRDRSRFIAAAAGRQSGKTEAVKRKAVLRSLADHRHLDSWFLFTAPTHQQAKRLYWRDLKALIPSWMIEEIYETELRINMKSGTDIQVLGMDKAERTEGRPISGIVMDEYANMKEHVWDAHVRPNLTARNGWAYFLGVPEGRNHFFTLCMDAQELEGWSYYHWKSSELIPEEELEEISRRTDQRTFEQEYEASFKTFGGRAYYEFDRNYNCQTTDLEYDKNATLIVCLDFNQAPGVAAICQEFQVSPGSRETVTGVIGEVWIERDSKTPYVCQKIIAKWGGHQGQVHIYGDSTGGAGGSAKVQGSDWDLVRDTLKPTFGRKIRFYVPKANPRERARLNAMNSRIKAKDGTIRLLVDLTEAPHVVRDLENVETDSDGSLIKEQGSPLTHVSDGLGYYVCKKFPTSGGAGTIRAA